MDMERAFKACLTSFAMVGAFSFCVNLLALAVPLYLVNVYDHVLPSRSVDTLIMLTLIVIVAVAVSSALESIRRELLSRIGGWLDDRLQLPVLGAAFQAALRNDVSGAAQTWKDLGTLRNYFGGTGVVPLLDAPWSPIFVAALFLIHPVLGWLGLGGASILFALALVNEVSTRRPLARATAAQAKTQHRLTTVLRNAEAIRAMGMTAGVARMLLAEQADAREAQAAASRRSSLVQGISKFVRHVVQILMMGSAAWLVINKDVSPGAIFACSMLLSRSLAPVEGAIGSWKAFSSSRLAYRRLVKALPSTPPRAATRLPAPEGSLRVERVTFFPPGTYRPVLRRVSLALEPGEVLGIVGPSGAGKSTLARLIAGTWNPTAGNVRLDGADISAWLSSGGARHLGYLPQDVELFDATVTENIARLEEADAEEVIAAAQLVGLHDVILRLPDGYDTVLGEGGVRLSGGQRQRLGLARAFFREPSLVVLDEPNANLDREGEEALYRTIEQMKIAGTTIVVVAHRMNILNVTDKLLLLRDGAVNAFGPTSDIMTRISRPRVPNATRPKPRLNAKATHADPPADPQNDGGSPEDGGKGDRP